MGDGGAGRSLRRVSRWPTGSQSGRLEFGGRRTRSSPRACSAAARSCWSSAHLPRLPRRLRLVRRRWAGARRRGQRHRLARPDRQPRAGARLRARGVDRAKARAALPGSGDRGRGRRVFPFVTLPETSAERLEGTVQNPSAASSRTVARGSTRRPWTSPRRTRCAASAREGSSSTATCWPTGGEVPAQRLPRAVVRARRRSRHCCWRPRCRAAVPALPARCGWPPRTRTRRFYYVFGGLFLFQLFAVQFSGDINDNRTFWAMFGVAWLMAQYGIPRDDRPDTDGPSGSGTLSSEGR